MENNEESKSVCSSVFKSGESTTSKTQFTQKWIEIINNDKPPHLYLKKRPKGHDGMPGRFYYK